jgi:nucleoside-diphosphate-sugar epimerase
MSMPAALVSGGTGFVGRFIVERLIADDYGVTVLGRTPPAGGLFRRPVQFVEGALDPGRDQAAAFRGIDVFVHAAFDHLPGKYRGGEGGDPQGFWRRNHEGSMSLFEAARRSGVGRAVFLSSRAAYGVQAPGVRLSEEMPCFPETLYGEVKLATEKALRELDGPEFVAVSLRVTGVYGPAGAGRAHKWTDLIEDYLEGKEIKPRAGSEVHGEDVAAAVALVLAVPAERVPGEIFNVSDI